MSLRELVIEVAELCGRAEFSSLPIDLTLLGVSLDRCHTSVIDYFRHCVPNHCVERPFFIPRSAEDVADFNADYTPSRQILPFGFITFANEPNGDLLAVDVVDGRVYCLSHEIIGVDGIHDFSADHPTPITRESILERSQGDFSSIRAFFESWRLSLVELHRKKDEFIAAALEDPNVTDEFGNTLLIHCVIHGTPTMKRILRPSGG